MCDHDGFAGEGDSETVLLHGTLLSSFARDAAFCAVGDSEGLLWGAWQHRTLRELGDTQSQGTERTTRTALVQAYSFCGGLHSFYDARGRVDLARLAALGGPPGGSVGGDTAALELVGWFVARRNTPLRPSAREAAVTARLTAALAAAPLVGNGSRIGSGGGGGCSSFGSSGGVGGSSGAAGEASSPVGVGQLQHLARGMQLVRGQLGGAPEACEIM